MTAPSQGLRSTPGLTDLPHLSTKSNVYKPLLRAYVLALLSTTSPKVIGLLLSLFAGRSSLRDAAIRVYKTLRSQMGVTQLPASCAILVGGATLLPGPLDDLLTRVLGRPPKDNLGSKTANISVAVRFIAALIAADISFRLINHRPTLVEHSEQQNFRVPSVTDLSLSSPLAASEAPAGVPRRRSSVAFSAETRSVIQRPVRRAVLSGRTLDLSLFVLVRSLDIGANAAWEWYKRRVSGTRLKSSGITRMVEYWSAPALFATSSYAIMWAWFYTPQRLPKAYNNWIASAAELDPRLLQALRDCRFGNFIYGQDTGANYLETMCAELGLPRAWGNPSMTIPIPCQLYHEGIASCEIHALSRFFRAWRFAMSMYLPLNLIMLTSKGSFGKSMSRAFQDAARSSSFLGGFVALFYYGVCLARTRVLPKLFSRKTYSAMMQDGGVCVAAGCGMCGLSILAEKESRRQEITFFVAPRALATVLPRRYERKHLWREELAFAVGSAVVLTTAQIRPERVRGVFGRLLQRVLES